MRTISFRTHVLPHLVAVIVFLAVTILFFSPVFFDSMSLDQYDINQWKGGAQEIITERESTGEEPLWTNSMFSGMPAYLIDVKWSDGLLTNFKIIAALGLPHPVRNIFLAFISFYILLLAFRVRPYLAIAGALAFGLSTYLIIGIAAGHNARIGAIAFMPLVMAGIHLAFSRKLLLGGGLTALATALQLRENHLQITYYLLLIIVIYGIVQLYSFYREGQLQSFFRSTGVLLLAALLAFGTFFGKFWAISEYSKYSMRGVSELQSDIEKGENASGLKKDYAFEYSYGLLEPMTLFVPQFYGGSSSNLLVMDEDSETLAALRTASDPQLANQLARYSSAYWGPQPYSSPYYIGAVMIFLFIIGIVFAERKYVVWLVAVSVLGILLSFGDNLAAFNYAMFDYFPGYNKFRSVTFAIVLPVLAIPLLGMLGIERFLSLKPTPDTRKKFMISLAVPAGICVILLLFAPAFDMTRAGEEQLPSWFLNALEEDRAGLLRADAMRSFLFVSLSAALIFFGWTGRIKPLFWIPAIVILVLADSWTVNMRYFGEDNYRRISDRSFFAANEADKAILQDKEQGYRVLNLQNPFAEARTSYFHQSIGGYHGAKIRRYQDLVDYCLQNEMQTLVQSFQTGNTSMAGYGVINMLNAKYIVYGPERSNIIVNDQTNGPAWFVSELIPAEGADAELERTCGINTRQEAVVDVTKFDVSPGSYSTGTLRVDMYSPGHIKYTSTNDGNGIAVFSEIYYPEGWKVTIDNEPVEMFRVNYVLRALEIPAGSHSVEFSFEPKAYATGNPIILISSILLMIGFAASVALSFRKWKSGQ